jgi:hypothetical protein
MLDPLGRPLGRAEVLAHQLPHGRLAAQLENQDVLGPRRPRGLASDRSEYRERIVDLHRRAYEVGELSDAIRELGLDRYTTRDRGHRDQGSQVTDNASAHLAALEHRRAHPSQRERGFELVERMTVDRVGELASGGHDRFDGDLREARRSSRLSARQRARAH